MRSVKNLNTDFQNAQFVDRLLFENVLRYAMVDGQIHAIVHELQALLEGQLHPNLIPISIIQKTIKDLNSLIQEHYPSFQLLTQSPYELYAAKDHVTMRKDNIYFINSKFYVTSIKQPIKLYKIISFQVPVSENASHATTIENIAPYFGILTDNSYHAYFQQMPTLERQKYIHASQVQLTNALNSCLISIYQNDASKVHQNCEINFLKNSIKPEIIPLSSKSAVLINVENYNLHCPMNQSEITGCSFCKINIPAGCSLIANNQFLPANSEIKEILPHSQYYLTNLLVLQKVFGNQAENLTSDMLFHNKLEIYLPEIQFFNQTSLTNQDTDSKHL